MPLRTAFLCCLVLASASFAEEKVAKKPLGTWARENNGHKFVFAIKAETLTIHMTNAQGSLVAEANYGVTSDGTLFGILTKVETKGIENGPQKGDLFGFDFSANKTELTLSNLKGTRTSEGAAKTVEGVYALEKKK